MKKLLFLLLTTVSCWLPRLASQITISAEDLTICSGGTVSVDISVTNFNDVTSMSFPIKWNPAVLQYTGQTVSLPPVFGVNNANAGVGQLLFSWFDPSFPSSGLDLPNGATIITVHFNVLGNYVSNNFTAITLTDPGFPSEVYTVADINNPAPGTVFDPGSVTIADSQNPTFSGCPPIVTVMGQTATWTPPAASDNCAVASVMSNYAPGATFPPGTTTVTYTATDGAGNTGTCSFPVTVVGSQLTFIATNDTLGCGDTTVQVQVRVTNFSNVAGFQFGLAFDTSLLNFTTAGVSGSFPPSSILNVDSAGIGQIRFSWFDATPPLGDVTLPANTLVLTLNFTLDDLSVDSAAVEFASFPTFFMLFLDQNGNTIPMNGVTLIDSEILIEADDPPVFSTCPGNITVPAQAGQCGATVSWAVPTATDDCGTPTVVRTQGAAPGSFFSVGTQTIVYVATDSLGQKDTCKFNVVVTDTQLPGISCPASQTLANDAGICGAVVTWTAPTPTDNCPGATATSSHPSGSTFFVGTTTVTYTAIDASNNQSTCSFTVTVTDQQSPALGPCPANITQSADPGVCQTTVTWSAPTATDNCTLVSNTPSIAPGSIFPVDTTTVTYTATDQVGNISTCSFLVIVEDDENPAITCPSNVSVSNTPGQCDGIATWTAPTPSDNCPGVTASASHAPGSTFNVGMTTVTYAAVDAAGNTANCSFTVTVEDVENPAISCPGNVTVSNTLGQCDGIATWTTPTPTDNCPGVTASASHNSGDTFPLDTTVVTYTATDAANNTATCSFLVVVEDDENPVITCPGNLTVSNTPGQCDGIATWTAPTPTDNCPGVSVSGSHSSGDTFPVNTTTVTYTATDAAGNTATCTFTVTVEDNENPAITCPGNLNVSNTSGQCDGIATWTAPTPADNCPGVSVSGSHSPGSTFPVGTTTVTYTATDAESNSSTCTFNVVVEDDEAPVIPACPADISQSNDLGDCGAIVFFNTPAATDNCALASILSNPAPGSFFDTGITTVTFTATDTAGNIATCQFLVTVTDEEAPAIANCPLIIEQGTDSSFCDAVVMWTEPTATDNCLLASFISDFSPLDTLPTGSTTVTYTATDTAGNVTVCSFDVVVSDQEPPTIVDCPGDITMDNIAGQCTAKVVWTAPTSFDNCPGDTLTGSHQSGTLFNVGTTTVTYQAIDAAGNDAFCIFEVEVLDVEAPEFTACTSDTTVTADSACQAIVTWIEPVAADNCPSFTVTRTHNPGDAFPTGITTVLYVVTDAGGNTDSCSFNITVEDDLPPVISGCPGDISQGTDSSFCSAAVSWVEPLASDNCALASFTTTHNPQDIFLPGTTTVTYTATDSTGNETICEFDVTVTDDEQPVITGCPGDLVLQNEQDSCSAIANWAPLTVTDNCPGVTLVSNFDPSDRFPVDTTNVNYVATDSAGNEATCSFLVIVQDTVAPVLANCPADTTVAAAAGACSAVVNWVSPNVSDNCDFTLSCTHLPGDTFPVGTTNVVCTVEDEGGNQVTCSFDVTVTDNQPPALVCPPNDTILLTGGDTTAVVTGIGLVSITENCGIDSMWFTLTGATAGGAGTGSGTVDVSGTTFNEGATTVTYFAEDESGNVSSCSFVVMLEGFIPLDLDCPTSVQTDNDPGNCSAVVLNLTPSISPLDSLASLDFVATGATSQTGNDASGLPFEIGLTTVTYTATDHDGNIYTCSFTVEVEDTELPVFNNCVGNDTVSTTNTMCGFSFIGNVLPVASDNCPGVTYTYLPAAGTLLPIGTTPVSALATDSAGNQAICTYNITVVDDDAPVISGCPGNITVPADQGQCGAIVNWVEPTATDNCQLLAFTPSQGPNTFFPAGNIPTPVEYVAVDNAGNVAKCQFTVTVNDQQAPVLVCPGNLTVNAAPNQCSAFVTWALPAASDNCAVLSLNANLAPGNFDVGSYTVSFSAVDAAGNSGVCNFTVTVVDNQFPVFTFVPQDITVLAEPGLCGANVPWSLPVATDNCGPVTLTGSHAPGSFFPAGGEVEVEYTAVDENGNATVVSFTVEVLDMVPPAFNCPEDVTISTDGNLLNDPSGVITSFQSIDCENIQLSFQTPSATDDCGISTVVQTEGLASGSIFSVGTVGMTFLATDNSGVPNTCHFDIIVEAPAAVSADAFPANPCEGDAVFFFVNDYPGATFEWKDPLGNVVATSSFFNLNNISAQQSGTFTVEIDLPSNCTLTGSVDVVVNPNPQITATANDLLCTDGTGDIQLCADLLNAADVVEWKWIFPNQTFALGQCVTVEDATVADAGIYTVMATTANGCLSMASVEVEITTEPIQPGLTLTSGDNSLCLGQTATLTGQIFSGGNLTYHWFANPAQSSGLIASNNYEQVVQPTAAGTYTYYYYVESAEGCQSDNSGEVTITVEALPTLNPQVLGDTSCVDGTTSVTLQANATGNVVEWSWQGVTVPFSSTLENPVLNNVSASNSGTYQVTATTMNGCSDTELLLLEISNGLPNPVLTAAPGNACVDAPITLTAEGNYPPGTQFIWTGNNLPPSAPFLQFLTVTPSATGNLTYTFQAAFNGCSTTVASATVNVEEELTVNIQVQGTTDCVAEGSTVTLVGSPSGSLTYEWRKLPGNTVISEQQNLVLNNVDADDSGIYSLTVFSSLGCEGMGTTELNITNALPPLQASLNGNPCEEGDLTLCTSQLPGATYQWQNPEQQIIANSSCVTIPNASAGLNGTYTVTATVDGCMATGSVPVSILTAPVATPDQLVVFFEQSQSFDVIANDALIEGEDYTITILESPTKGSVSYVGNGVFTYTSLPGFSENDRMVYEICYTDCPDLCDIALVTLLVRHPETECLITSLISPNNDGINDALVVSCLDETLPGQPGNRIVIFNQWGDKVYEAQPYQNNWQGTYEDGYLPDGTYFYIFQRDPQSPEQKGFVMIYR